VTADTNALQDAAAKATALARSPLCEGLPDDCLQALARIAVVRTFNRDETIFMEGERAAGFHVLVRGSAKVYKLSADGREHILHVFGDGEPFGEAAVFSGEAFPAHATALSKATTLYFERSRFADLLSRRPELAMNMLATLAARLQRFASIIEDLSLKDVNARLARYLINLSTSQNSARRVTLDISKGQLASRLGTVAETLSRALRRLQEDNVISVERRNVAILDRERLAEIARGTTPE